jgi:pyruvate ferredoxin oxidoreductase gamma subunit
MFQVRIHGRGGQGVVTAAELLSVAAFLDGAHAQAFPSFGSERTGAPVVAFCRMDDREIRVREPIVAPDALIVQDPTLLHQVDLFSGLRPGARVLLNSSRPPAELGLEGLNVVTISASRFPTRRCSAPSPPSPAPSRSTRWRPPFASGSPPRPPRPTSRRRAPRTD